MPAAGLTCQSIFVVRLREEDQSQAAAVVIAPGLTLT